MSVCGGNIAVKGILVAERRSYHHGNLHNALVERAIALLEGGERPADLSVRSLAADLGVSPAAPYRHFASHEALLAAIAARGFERLDVALEPAGGDLEALGAAYLEFAVAHPQLYRAMFALPRDRAAGDPALATASNRAYERLRSAVECRRDVAAGRLPGPTATLAAWAYVHGLASLAIDGLVAPEVVTEGADLVTVLTRGL